MQVTFYNPNETTSSKRYSFNTKTNYDRSIIANSEAVYEGQVQYSPISGKSFSIDASNIKAKYSNIDREKPLLGVALSNSMEGTPQAQVMIRNASFDKGFFETKINVIGGDIAIVEAKGNTFIGYVDTISYEYTGSESQATIIWRHQS